MSASAVPDISAMSLTSQHPSHEPLDYDYSHISHSLAIRPLLPSQWVDNCAVAEHRSLSPNNNSDFSSSGGSPRMGHLPPPPILPSTPTQNAEDEIIPTAIVIKNIPFNVKRETLLDIIASLSIPTPYAFNYHLDQQGSFRGLAFANFRQAADADAVVVALNGFEVQGRKLRVEYKKVLQAGEKERIEREKALRRMRSMQLDKGQQMRSMQLENEQQAAQHPHQYDDFGPISFPSQRSFSSGIYHHAQYSPPSLPPLSQTLNPVTTSPLMPATSATSDKVSSPNELDLNDPSTLEIYSRILLFKDDPMRDELAFSRTLTPKQRRVVHLIAQKLGVYHYSVGEGEDRYAVVTRFDPNRNRAAVSHTLSRAPSAYLSPTSQSSLPSSLRMKKSMPDMKSLHTQAPRLTTRASNGNIREGYATIASPSRRSPGGFGSLFGNGPFGNTGSSIPPVPSLPSSVTGVVNGGLNESPGSGVVRQPRGPSNVGFGRREAVRLEARTHEPLEI